jgi:hypothetical protein
VKPRPVVLALLAVGLVSCGLSGQSRTLASHPARPTPSNTASPATAAAIAALPSPPAPGQPVQARLTIRGSTSTDVAVTQSQGACGKGAAGYAAQLTFPIRDRAFVLSLQVIDYRGPGQYTMPPERVSLHTETGDPNPVLAAATSGTVVIDADERSGSINATFSDHSVVTGTWACSP